VLHATTNTSVESSDAINIACGFAYYMMKQRYGRLKICFGDDDDARRSKDKDWRVRDQVPVRTCIG
jgi:hypothetical protein